MQGHRPTILTAFAVLLAFAGCNSQPPQAAAPVAAAGGQPAAAAKPSDPPATKLTILHRKGSRKGEAHQLVTNGTTVEWEYDQPGYYVNFVGTSPCGVPSIALSSTPGMTEPYTASCKITATQAGLYLYTITNKPSTQPADSKTGKTGTHCEGCVLEMSGS